jgi:isochorismate pyruvate lyase
MEYPKKPEDCENIGQVRNALDQIDMEIIQLFALRNKYVREIVKFKIGDEGIRARERREVVLEQRKAWAEERDLDPEMMEEIFKILIEKNIQIQFDIYKTDDR